MCFFWAGRGGGINNDLFLDLDSGYIAMFVAHF